MIILVLLHFRSYRYKLTYSPQLRWGPYNGQNLPKVGSRHSPHEILHRPPEVYQRHMILDYLNFPMLNPHRQVCKCGPHLSCSPRPTMHVFLPNNMAVFFNLNPHIFYRTIISYHIGPPSHIFILGDPHVSFFLHTNSLSFLYFVSLLPCAETQK